MIDIDNLTIGEARKLAATLAPFCSGASRGTAASIPDHPYPVGEAVFIRAVPMHYTGRLVRVTAGELVLEDAAWVADSGRFHQALMNGTLKEVEPYPDGEVVVPRGALIDVSRWLHELPRSPK